MGYQPIKTLAFGQKFNQILKVGRSFVSYGYDESSPYKNASQLLSRNNFDWA
jgi:hypothetical protein